VATLNPPPGSGPSEPGISLREGSLVVGRGLHLPLIDKLSRSHVEFWVSLDGPVVLATKLGVHQVSLTRHLHLAPEILEKGKPVIVREHDVVQFLDDGTPYTFKFEPQFQPAGQGALQYALPKPRAQSASVGTQSEPVRVTQKQALTSLAKGLTQGEGVLQECRRDPTLPENQRLLRVRRVKDVRGNNTVLATELKRLLEDAARQEEALKALEEALTDDLRSPKERTRLTLERRLAQVQKELDQGFEFFEKSLLHEVEGQRPADFFFTRTRATERNAQIRKKYCQCFAGLTHHADTSKVAEALKTLGNFVADYLGAADVASACRLLVDVSEYYVDRSPEDLSGPEEALAASWIALVEKVPSAEQGQTRKELENFLQVVCGRFKVFEIPAALLQKPWDSKDLVAVLQGQETKYEEATEVIVYRLQALERRAQYDNMLRLARATHSLHYKNRALILLGQFSEVPAMVFDEQLSPELLSLARLVKDTAFPPELAPNDFSSRLQLFAKLSISADLLETSTFQRALHSREKGIDTQEAQLFTLASVVELLARRLGAVSFQAPATPLNSIFKLLATTRGENSRSMTEVFPSLFEPLRGVQPDDPRFFNLWLALLHEYFVFRKGGRAPDSVKLGQVFTRALNLGLPTFGTSLVLAIMEGCEFESIRAELSHFLVTALGVREVQDDAVLRERCMEKVVASVTTPELVLNVMALTREKLSDPEFFLKLGRSGLLHSRGALGPGESEPVSQRIARLLVDVLVQQPTAASKVAAVFDEAIRDWSACLPYLDYLIQQDRVTEALGFCERHIEKPGDVGQRLERTGHLLERGLALGNKTAVLHIYLLILRREPTLILYRRAAELSQEVGEKPAQWKKARNELVEVLMQRTIDGSTPDHLAEDLVPSVLEILALERLADQLQAVVRARRDLPTVTALLRLVLHPTSTTGGDDLYDSLAEEVEAVLSAETTLKPEFLDAVRLLLRTERTQKTAIEVTQQVATNVISKIAYGNYRDMQVWMDEAREIFVEAGCEKEWKALFGRLRRQFGNKTSLWRDIGLGLAEQGAPKGRKTRSSKGEGK